MSRHLAEKIIRHLLEELTDHDIIDDYQNWLIARGGKTPDESSFGEWIRYHHPEREGDISTLWDLLQDPQGHVPVHDEEPGAVAA